MVKLTKAQQAIIDKDNAFWQGVDDKTKTLERNTGRKIVPITIQHMTEPGEYVVGYMYRPDLTTQLRLSDKGQGFATGFSQEEASKVLQSLLIPTDSDPRINITTEEGEMYWKGALLVLFQFVSGAVPVIKKK